MLATLLLSTSGSAAPPFSVGTLSLSAPPLTAARQAAGLPDDTRARVRTAGPGQMVLLYTDPGGVESLEPDAVVWVNDAGIARLARIPQHTYAAQDAPLISSEQVRAATAEWGSVQLGAVVWRLVGGSLRRAVPVHVVHPARGMRHPILWVDAVLGEIVSVEDGAVHAAPELPQAYAYLENPIKDEEPSLVTLPEELLSDERVTLLQCRDTGETYSLETDIGVVDIRYCSEEPMVPSADGWIYAPIPWPEDPGRDEDDFVGPHMYWNVHRTLDWFDALGLDEPARKEDWPTLEAVVNKRDADMRTVESMSEPQHALVPYNNAYFMRGYTESDETLSAPRIVFGQGEVIDYGYDTDVIVHELGHYAVWMQSGPSSVIYSTYGSSIEPRALNEGFADYFSGAMIGNPELAEYAGENRGNPYIRSLVGDARCPDALYGESHYDSQPFSQALWSVRSSLSPEQQVALDTALLSSLPLLGTSAGFTDAAAILPISIGEMMGAETQAALESAFAERGVDRCAPVLPVTPGEPVRSFGVIPAHWFWFEGPVPSTVQYELDAEGPIEVTVSMIQYETLEVDLWGDNEPADLLLLARAGAPIEHTNEWRYVEALDANRYVWENNGTRVAVAQWVEEVEDTDLDDSYAPHLYRATFTLEGAGPHYVQLANEDERSSYAIDVTFEITDVVDESVDSGAAVSDTGPGAEPGEAPSGGCSCAAIGLPGGGGWLGGLLMLWARRRRRGND